MRRGRELPVRLELAAQCQRTRGGPFVPPGFVDGIVNEPGGDPLVPPWFVDDLAGSCQRTRVWHAAIAGFVDTPAEDRRPWRGVVGEQGSLIGWDDFGISAPNEVIGEKLGMKAEVVADKVERWLGGLA